MARSADYTGAKGSWGYQLHGDLIPRGRLWADESHGLHSNPGPFPLLYASISTAKSRLSPGWQRGIEDLTEMQGRVLAPSAIPTTHLPKKPTPSSSCQLGNRQLHFWFPLSQMSESSSIPFCPTCNIPQVPKYSWLYLLIVTGIDAVGLHKVHCHTPPSSSQDTFF